MHLLTLAAWYEDPRFDDPERAALALTEAATRLCDRPGAVTDEIWAEAARHYDERQLGALVLMVAITNFFNRLNTTFRVPAGTELGLLTPDQRSGVPFDCVPGFGLPADASQGW